MHHSALHCTFWDMSNLQDVLVYWQPINFNGLHECNTPYPHKNVNGLYKCFLMIPQAKNEHVILVIQGETPFQRIICQSLIVNCLGQFEELRSTKVPIKLKQYSLKQKE